MEQLDRVCLLNELRQGSGSVASVWYDAISLTGFVPSSAAEVRQRLASLVDRIISILSTEGFDPAEAQAIGVALVRLHYLEPQTLSGTQQVLSRWLAPLRNSGMPVLVSDVRRLLAEIATGFLYESRKVLLAEQESVRKALSAEVQSAGRALREAHDSLDMQVKQRTQELQASEERWRLLVESLPDPVVAVDAEGRMLYANYVPLANEIPAHEALGRSVFEFVLPDHRGRLQDAIRQAFSTGTGNCFEIAVPRAGAETRWYSTSVGALRRDGQTAAAMIICRDTTGQKKMDQLKDNFVRDASHQLRTPLAKLQMSLERLSEMIEAGQLDWDKMVKLERLATANVHRLTQMVEIMLDLTSLEAGASAYRMAPLRLGELIASSLEDAEPIAEAKALALVANVAEGLPLVRGDGTKLLRVMAHLLDNAVKFSSAGKISVSAYSQGDEVVVAVCDEGQGILPENLEVVFQRFYQEEPHFPGLGIGLTIARTIIEEHGGRSWAESAGRGQGTVVRFALPAWHPRPGGGATDLGAEVGSDGG